MKIQPPRKCDKCGEQFIPRNSKQHFCRKVVIRNCLLCGSEFETNCSKDMKLVCSNPECAKQANQVSEPVDKICKACGDKFTTIFYKRNYCNVEKEKNCPTCGKLFKYTCNADSHKTCSIQCQAKFIVKARREHIANEIRICKWCGKEFTPREYRDVYCYDTHYKKCKICGKDFEIDVRKDSYVETCSKECMGKLMSQSHDYEKGVQTYQTNMLKKYGVPNSFQLPQFREKAKQTSLAKYGTEWYTQTEEYKQKAKKTNLERYGTEWYLGSKESIERRTETVRQVYGVDNVFQAESIKEKMKQTNLAKYGVEYASQSEEVKKRVANNNLEKYGVEYPMMLPEVQQKAKETNLKLYGRIAYTQRHIKNIENWYSFMADPRSYIASHYDKPPKTDELAKDLGVDLSTIDVYLGRHQAYDCVGRHKSKMEEEIIQFIHSIDKSIKVVSCCKSVIRPKELDIYLPDYNFAIECDPTATHNSSVPDPWGGEPKPYNYHLEKTDECDAKGVFLLHVFGYDWTHRKDIILSMIKNKLGKSDAIIYARKCKIVEVDGVSAIKFLNENHRQGAANSKVRLGLEYEGRLVSLMTFGKIRSTIGTGSENLDDCWELVRFCSTLNTNVVGGASKLFKYFVKQYLPKRIRSFSDRAHTSGKLYPTLRFKEVRRSNAGYVWVDILTDKSYHRVNAQKQNLKRFLDDDTIDLTKTEREIMIEHGFVQMYDSGTITWEWSSEQ